MLRGLDRGSRIGSEVKAADVLEWASAPLP